MIQYKLIALVLMLIALAVGVVRLRQDRLLLTHEQQVLYRAIIEERQALWAIERRAAETMGPDQLYQKIKDRQAGNQPGKTDEQWHWPSLDLMAQPTQPEQTASTATVQTVLTIDPVVPSGE